jgi:hypothetical protein
MIANRSLRIVVAIAVTALGCTQDFGVFEPHDASTSDGSPSDGGSDAVAPPDAAPDAPPPGDGGALMFTCNGGSSVADCSQCSGNPQPCVYCRQGNPSNLAGRCTTMNGSCFQGAPSGYSLCSCTNASTCPEAYQVCRNQTCRTCSDSSNNDGLTCQGGGTCDHVDGGCI